MTRRYLSVEDYSEGIHRSRNVDTDIPFMDNYQKVQSIKQSEVVIAAYTNANYNELQNYNRAVEEIRQEVEGFSETKQNTLTAGNNITITDENVISSVDTTYTAGSNVQISDENVISATDTTYTAGTGIEITEGNVINNTQSGAVWGNITGTLSDQTDLNNALTGLSNDISDKQDIIDNDNKLPYSYLSGTPTIPTPLTVHSNTDDNPYSCNYINDLFTFSTSEKRIGTWIDGKPLYAKTLSFDTNAANGTTILHNIANVDIIFPIIMFLNHSNGITYPLPINLYGAGSTSNQDRLSIYVDRTNIVFKADTNYGAAWTKNIVLCYTKTTD